MKKQDDVYVWSYKVNLFKNPTILFTLFKIFGGIILAMTLISFIVELFGDHNYIDTLKFSGIMLALMGTLCLIGYFIYACIMGFNYNVKFVMDKKGILHQQEASQAKKANKVAEITTITGALTGNLTVTGIGMSSAKRTSMYTSFEGVKKLTSIKRRNLIKMDSLFDHNQIYCSIEDFDFIWDYIKEKCNTAKVKIR